VGPGAGRQGQSADDGRRQRPVHQGSGARAGSGGARPWGALDPLFDAGRQRRREGPQRRGRREVRGEQRREAAGAGGEGHELHSLRKAISASSAASGCSTMRSWPAPAIVTCFTWARLSVIDFALRGGAIRSRLPEMMSTGQVTLAAVAVPAVY